MEMLEARGDSQNSLWIDQAELVHRDCTIAPQHLLAGSKIRTVLHDQFYVMLCMWRGKAIINLAHQRFLLTLVLFALFLRRWLMKLFSVSNKPTTVP